MSKMGETLVFQGGSERFKPISPRSEADKNGQKIDYRRRPSKHQPSHSSENQPKKELYFVKVVVGTPQQSSDPEEQRSVRSHVMKDYLRNIDKPKTSIPLTAPEMSKQMSRFRSGKKKDPRVSGSRGQKEARLTSNSNSNVSTPESNQDIGQFKAVERKCTPADQINVKQPAFLDFSSSQTFPLLDYNHPSFWEDFYAADPEGHWLGDAISESPVLHTGLHLSDQNSQELFSEYSTQEGIVDLGPPFENYMDLDNYFPFSLVPELR